MEDLEITSVSSRGQVVIPQKIRDKLKILEGEKFVVVGENDTIVLKKLEVPSFKGFEKLLRKTREHAVKHGLSEKDMLEAIGKTRKK